MKALRTLILLLTFGLPVSAQVTLEHSYSHSGTLTEIAPGEFKYFMMDATSNQCTIYNEDHSLFKSINLAVPSGYYMYDLQFVTRNLFNADDKIELLYVYAKTETINSTLVNTYGMKIINEDGSVLMTLNNGGYAELKSGSEGTKLLAYQYIWSGTYYMVSTNVYSLNGNTETEMTQATMQPGFSAYPNPVSDVLHIESSVNGVQFVTASLHDQLGKTLIKANIAPQTGTARMNTHHLPAGNYILQLSKEDGTSCSTQMIKNR